MNIYELRRAWQERRAKDKLLEDPDGVVRRYARTAFCDHKDLEFVRNAEDDAVPLPAWAKSVWRCQGCRTFVLKEETYVEH